MSAKLTKALEFSNYRVTLNNQQEALKARVESLLSYSINGGTFTIDRTLISFCKLLLDDRVNEAVLSDIYNNPILIEIKPFYEEIMSRYFEATNQFYAEYQQIRQSRKIHKVLDLHD